MQVPQDVSLFEAKPSRWLRRAGVRGVARVRLNPDGLGIIGSEGGAVEITPSKVVQLRAGTERLFRGAGFHEARLRVAGKPGVLVLRPTAETVQGFGGVTVGLAAQIDAGGHPGRLELGESAWRLIWVGALMCLPLVLSVIVLTNRTVPSSGLQAAGLLAVPVLMAVAGLVVCWRGWPRVAASSAQFRAAVETWIAR